MERRGRTFDEGPYRGIVEDVDDPKGLSRVRVRVVTVLGSVLTGWARVGGRSAAGVPGTPFGTVDVPPKGSPVEVEFEAGDPNRAAWRHGWFAEGAVPPRALGEVGTPREQPTDTGAKPPQPTLQPAAEPYAGQYPHVRMIRLPDGTELEVDGTPGAERLKLRHGTGKFVAEVDREGRLYLVAGGEVYERFLGRVQRVYLDDLDEVVKGRRTLKVVGDLATEVGGKEYREVTGKAVLSYLDELEVTGAKGAKLTLAEKLEVTAKEATLTTQQAVRVEAGTTLDLVAGTAVRAEAGTTLDLVAGGALTVEAAAAATVRAGTVLDLVGPAVRKRGKAVAVAGDPVVGDAVRARD